ncbi:MAG: type III PLP-dependent enzyme, partial [Alphaproteobacteria bacterium]|nr:type III PLP-dependent enzyme [Alphaproteobacteria bacterium]
MKHATFEPPGRALRQTSVIPLQRQTRKSTKPLAPATPVYRAAEDMVHELRPVMPITCLRPATIASTTKWFLKSFPGEVMYAVKTNPDARVLKVIYHAGVRHFDVASLAEIKAVVAVAPDAQMYFMHPVKSRQAISRAYYEFGIRCFVLDSFGELQKILDETGFAQDLTLVVRLATPNKYSELDLSGKFGAPPAEAEKILRYAEKFCARLGVSFHVGSQCMNPQA